MKKNYIKIILSIFLLVFIDQLSKILINCFLNPNDYVMIISNFFKLFYIKNTGAAFGIMSGNKIFLFILTLTIIIFLLIEIKNNIKDKKILIPLIFIVSGAIGNLIDRICRGFVVDFISFTMFKHDFAVFNIADAYITCGVIVLLILTLKEGKNGKSSSK